MEILLQYTDGYWYIVIRGHRSVWSCVHMEGVWWEF